MVQQQGDKDRISELDNLLRSGEDEFSRAALRNDGLAYSSWYSLLLTALTLVVGDEDMTFGQGRLDDHDVAHVIVFTTSLVAVATSDPALDASTSPVVTAVPRRSIQSFTVASNQGVDAQGSRARAWPEMLWVRARFQGLEEDIEIQGVGYDKYALDEPGSIRKLVNSLREDLKRASS
jgi:hypothetical protein